VKGGRGEKGKGGKGIGGTIAPRVILLLLFALSPLPLFPFSPFILSPCAYAQTGELDQLIRRVESRYGRMRSLAAEFEQTYTQPGGRTRRERGRLFLQRPRRMRWEYDPKPGKLFIVNGADVWLYVPADREAVHAKTNAVSDPRFPFLFLLGQTNLRRDFRSVELADQQSAPDVRVLRLTPRSNAYGLREILLEVFTDGRVSKVSLREDSGAVSEIALTNVRENAPVPAEAFVFTPPPGVSVRRQK
jgi:outer membrane lipoprotein carrier protein